MDIGKISQSTINQNIQNQKQYMTDGMREEIQYAFQHKDKDGDGNVTGKDLYQSWSNTCKNVFAGNDAFLKRGEELSAKQGEIYSMYAGEDGVLDEYEYNAALQSDEMGVLIDEYWAMKNEMEAMNGETEILGLPSYDTEGNRDGKVSASEITESKTNMFAKLYEESKIAQGSSKIFLKQQEEILKKFEGDDGHLSTEEFTQAVQSYEYQETLDKLNALDTVFKWFD